MLRQMKCNKKHFGKFYDTFGIFHFQNTTLFQITYSTWWLSLYCTHAKNTARKSRLTPFKD